VNGVTQHEFFLTDNGLALAATCFAPRAPRAAVLMIPPFAEERKGALPVFVQAARALASADIAALLFDFPGCGDSEGEFDALPPERFDRACETAWSWLAAAFPDAPRAILGARTGATLATRLAAARSDAAALALWAPVAGPDFVRQLLQRRMVNDMVAYGKARESRASLDARLRAGETVDLDGYPISGPFYAWLQQATPVSAACPVFLASGGHDEKTAAACAAPHAEVTRTPLRFPPFWNTVGHVDLTALISETAGWLQARIAVGPSAPMPAFPEPPASSISEQVSFGNEGQTVRAVWDIPHGAPRNGVLFLHGWSGDRTGPHRLFVRFARALAAQGSLCLRPDFFGRGVSDGDAADASIARMAVDAQTALNALRRRLPPGAPVAVVAICSGCKVAITLAADTPDLERLLLWSAESMGSLRAASTGLRKTLGALTAYAKKLTRPETWKKIISGKVRTDLVTKALVKHETRSADEARAEDGVLKRFRSFRRPILFVFGGSDPDAVGSSRAYADYCRKNGIPFSLHTVAHAGHSYYGEAWTRELLDVSQRFFRT